MKRDVCLFLEVERECCAHLEFLFDIPPHIDVFCLAKPVKKVLDLPEFLIQWESFL